MSFGHPKLLRICSIDRTADDILISVKNNPGGNVTNTHNDSANQYLKYFSFVYDGGFALARRVAWG